MKKVFSFLLYCLGVIAVLIAMIPLVATLLTLLRNHGPEMWRDINYLFGALNRELIEAVQQFAQGGFILALITVLYLWVHPRHRNSWIKHPILGVPLRWLANCSQNTKSVVAYLSGFGWVVLFFAALEIPVRLTIPITLVTVGLVLQIYFNNWSAKNRPTR